MEHDYEPELGQALFGQSYFKHPVPEYMIEALVQLSVMIQKFLSGKGHRNANPFDNNAAAFGCETFDIHAYDWNTEDEQPYNFHHPETGVAIKWYKYLGRGMTANRPISEEMAAYILQDCLSAFGPFAQNDDVFITSADGANIAYRPVKAS